MFDTIRARLAAAVVEHVPKDSVLIVDPERWLQPPEHWTHERVLGWYGALSMVAQTAQIDADGLSGALQALGPLDGRHVLVWTSDSDVELDDIDAIIDHYTAVAKSSGALHGTPAELMAPLIVHLRTGDTLDEIDEAEMAAHGWRRDD